MLYHNKTMRIRLINDPRTGQGPLFSRGLCGPNSRISAVEKLMFADNFLQKQQKQQKQRVRRPSVGAPLAADVARCVDPVLLTFSH
jgi:hypothetical protein